MKLRLFINLNLILTICTEEILKKDSPLSFREMSAAVLYEYLQNLTIKPLLIDVREPWEYQTCHIKDSVLIPMRQIPTALNELDPDRETVLICHHGIRSRSVSTFLTNNDFTQIINLSGGIDEWAKTVDDSMPVY